MKNPTRNVVVEYKNKRARKANTSLWGGLDLKSISREVEADIPQTLDEDGAYSGVSAPCINLKKSTATDELSFIAAAEKLEDEQRKCEPSFIGTKSLEKEAADPNPAQKSGVSEGITEDHKSSSVRIKAITALQKQQKSAMFSSTDENVRLELSLLESENVSLKRELVGKLLLENEKLSVMLAQVEQRMAQKK